MRRARTALILTTLALAVAGVAARPLAPRLRDAMFRGLVRLGVVVAEARAGTMTVPTEVDPAAPAVVEDPAEPLDEPAPAIGAGAPAPAPRPKAPQAAGAIDIPEDRVAHLTEKQLRSLRPANVIGADGAAAGVRLHGLGALGLGLADADIVTSIDGHPVSDVTTGMDAALRAWASGEAAAHATVRRAGRTLLVTVHIPKHSRIAPGLGRSAHLQKDD
ncbi:MAG TPA: hypothetical protein VF765_20850 [Polyangiaceae bacterium]